MSIKLKLPQLTDMRPRLTVIGVGGAGCNAINNMIAAGLNGVDFVVANTDAQSLAASSAEHRIQLGVNLTEGLGAGSKPEIGEAAAQEAVEEIRAQIAGSHMVFIAAGMGGGTGTGAAAVIARVARDAGILTVGVVTKPFQFEGARRLRIAEAGIAELRSSVDTLIVIPNQNLFRIANEKTTFAEAFVLADQVLYSGVACIVDLIIKEGLINLDFADVRTVLSGMGTAMMGTGEASGERRAIIAAEEAISNPLLDDVSLKGAKGLLLSITGGRNLTLYEVDEAASRVRQEVDPEANIIVGAMFDDALGDRVRVSIVASGMSRAADAFPANAPRAAAPVAPPVQAAPPAPQFMPPPPPAPEPAYAPPPEPVRQQAYAGAGHEPEVQRRLSEALQQAAAAAANHMPPSHAAEPAPAPRESWRAPGNVTIEDGLNPYAIPAAGQVAGRSGHDADYGAGAEFAPAAPAEIRRPGGARRMPEVDDFPAVGQREYRAKSGMGPPSEARSQPVPQPPSSSQPEDRRKPGFFGRLTGRYRDTGDSATEQLSGHSGGHGARAAAQGSERVSNSPAGSADRTGRSTGRTQEAPELPVFFTRERK
jgi:cell division protein FtsZ